MRPEAFDLPVERHQKHVLDTDLSDLADFGFDVLLPDVRLL